MKTMKEQRIIYWKVLKNIAVKKKFFWTDYEGKDNRKGRGWWNEESGKKAISESYSHAIQMMMEH